VLKSLEFGLEIFQQHISIINAADLNKIF